MKYNIRNISLNTKGEGNMAKLYEKYKLEPSETSSMSEGEMRTVLTKEGITIERSRIVVEEIKTTENTTPALSAVQKLLRGSMPRAEEISKGKKTPKYTESVKKYDSDFQSLPSKRELEDMSRRIDNRLKQAQDHPVEASNESCDLKLYRNKVAKELRDVANDLQEANNIVSILSSDRNVMKDQYAIFNVQIKGLETLKKNLEDALAEKDNEVEKIKAANDALRNQLEQAEDKMEDAKKEAAHAKAEANLIKQQLNDNKTDQNRMKRQVDPMKEEIERMRKEIERGKANLKNAQNELEKIKPEITTIRDEKKKFTTQNENLVKEKERLVKDNQVFKEEAKKIDDEVKSHKEEHDDLKKKVNELQDKIADTNSKINDIRTETRDLKPDNAKLAKKIDELTKEKNELLEENAKLKKTNPDTTELKEKLEPKVKGLSDENKALKEEYEQLMQQNKILKTDLNEILDEKIRRNAERRKKKEEQLKKLIDEAQKKIDDGIKKQNDKKNAIEATDLIKSVIQAQEDLKKYPEPKKEDDSGPLLMDDEPDIEIPDMPHVDRQTIDDQVSAILLRSKRDELYGLPNSKPSAKSAIV